MADNSSTHKNWDLMRDLSNEQSERLAKVILSGGTQAAPDNKVSNESFVQYVRNNEVSIAGQFDAFNEFGKYTDVLPMDIFTEEYVNIFINILITTAAMKIVGTYFYTD